MGGLIDRERRDRARQAKADRMSRIREEAVRSFVSLPYFEVTLDGIGHRAGVKKGVASMYFGTKEELYLELLRAELDGWYSELEQRLGAQGSRLSDDRLGRLVAGTLAARPVLARLVSLAPVVLEQSPEIVEAYRFQTWQRERMLAVGGKLELRSLGVREGRGVRLLHLVQLATASFEPFANPRGSLLVSLLDPDFEVFRIDLEQELAGLIVGLLAAKLV
jgi:AcrR family transcriptional regulator